MPHWGAPSVFTGSSLGVRIPLRPLHSRARHPSGGALFRFVGGGSEGVAFRPRCCAAQGFLDPGPAARDGESCGAPKECACGGCLLKVSGKARRHFGGYAKVQRSSASRGGWVLRRYYAALVAKCVADFVCLWPAPFGSCDAETHRASQSRIRGCRPPIPMRPNPD